MITTDLKSITNLKKTLSCLIINENYDLSSQEVINLSQELDSQMLPVLKQQLDFYNLYLKIYQKNPI